MNLQKAKQVLRSELNTRGLSNWNIKLMRSKQKFGSCRYSIKTIFLSSILVRLNTLEEVTKTILHEIAHAIVGPGHGHNSTWKTQMIAMGLNPAKFWSDSSRNVIGPKHKYNFFCPTCNGVVARYHRKPKHSHYEHSLCRTVLVISKV